MDGIANRNAVRTDEPGAFPAFCESCGEVEHVVMTITGDETLMEMLCLNP